MLQGHHGELRGADAGFQYPESSSSLSLSAAYAWQQGSWRSAPASASTHATLGHPSAEQRPPDAFVLDAPASRTKGLDGDQAETIVLELRLAMTPEDLAVCDPGQHQAAFDAAAFEMNLTRDLALATGEHPRRFLPDKCTFSAAGAVATVEILEEPWKAGSVPAKQIAAFLKRAGEAKPSPLFSGAVTRHVEHIRLMDRQVQEHVHTDYMHTPAYKQANTDRGMRAVEDPERAASNRRPAGLGDASSHQMEQSQVSKVTHFESPWDPLQLHAYQAPNSMLPSWFPNRPDDSLREGRTHDQQVAEIALKQSDLILDGLLQAKRENEELNQELDKTRRTLALLEKELDAANLQCALKEDEIRVLREWEIHHASEIAVLKDKDSALERELQDKTQKVASLQQEMRLLLDKYSQVLVENHTKQTAQGAAVEQLKAWEQRQRESRDSENDRHRQFVDEERQWKSRHEEFAGLTELCKLFEEDKIALQQQVAALQKELEKVRGDLSQTRRVSERPNGEMLTMTMYKAALHGKTEALAAEVTEAANALRTEIIEAERQRDALEQETADKATLQGLIVALQGQIATLQDQLTSIEVREKTMFQENVDLQREVKALKCELEEWTHRATEHSPTPPSLITASSVGVKAPDTSVDASQAHVARCRELIASSLMRTAEDHLVKHKMLTGIDERATTLGFMFDERQGKIHIDHVMVGGPASNSKKMQKGDFIMEIDGRQARGDEIVSALQGSAGTHVTLLVEKAITGKMEEVVLERMPTALIADERKLFDLFTKIEGRCNLHKDPVGVKHTEEALELWEAIYQEVREHDER